MEKTARVLVTGGSGMVGQALLQRLRRDGYASILAPSSKQLDLPEFYLRPEGMMERVLNTVSQVDIDFAERPGFSSKMLLYGKDEAAIRRSFTGPVFDFFEQNPYLCVFGKGDHLFYYQSRTLTPVNMVRQNVMFLPNLVNLFRSR